MLGGFIILPVTLIVMVGNPFQGVGTVPAGFWNPLTEADGEPITFFFLLSAAGWGAGFFGSQRLLQRFMAVESEEQIAPSRDLSYGVDLADVLVRAAPGAGGACRPYHRQTCWPMLRLTRSGSSSWLRRRFSFPR